MIQKYNTWKHDKIVWEYVAKLQQKLECYVPENIELLKYLNIVG